jgi:hypothetical protein
MAIANKGAGRTEVSVSAADRSKGTGRGVMMSLNAHLLSFGRQRWLPFSSASKARQRAMPRHSLDC